MVHSKTRIGISTRVVNASNYVEKRDAISQDWTNFLEKLDAFPIFIPNTLSNIESFLEEMEIDFLILSGGDNIGDNHERDKTEEAIISYGINHKIPIFGVCRGMQVINKHFGGSTINNGSLTHIRKPHYIQFIDPLFSKILQKESLEVNSFHSNIIKESELGEDLQTFAIANEDKTIEGFYHQNLPIIGVMWHPERDNKDMELELLKIIKNKKIWNK